MPSLRSGPLLAVALLCGSCASTPGRASRSASPTPRVVAFVHASVIPMDEERVLRDQAVVVADGKIVEIGPASAVKVPPAALRIDVGGRYLLPALCDMHVHLLGEAWKMMLSADARAASEHVPQEDFLFPYVANGVTTVQSLAATPEELALRGRIERGELLGPRLVLARMVDGPRRPGRRR